MLRLYIFYPAYLTYIHHAKYIMRNTGLDEARGGIKIAVEISITSDMQMTSPYGRKQRGTEEPLGGSEREE